jgi:hypothetical protein
MEVALVLIFPSSVRAVILQYSYSIIDTAKNTAGLARVVMNMIERAKGREGKEERRTQKKKGKRRHKDGKTSILVRAYLQYIH